MTTALEQAKQLQIQARSSAPTKPAEALALLEQAIALLGPVADSKPSSPVFGSIAECYGIRGGILRRLGRLDEAIKSYRDGAAYEQHEEFGVEDSYNQVNALLIPLLGNPARLDEAEFTIDLQQVLRQLRRQVRGARSNDYWAHADLARCLLFTKDYADADRSIDRFVQLGGMKEGFATSVQMLRELEEALSAAGRPEASRLSAAIVQFRKAAEAGAAADKPVCFVLMPFGIKTVAGRTVDFDAIYRTIIEPAIVDAMLEPLRADAEPDGGIIHKAMFERLLLCEYAIADLTLNNPNVFYELGVRHGSRARATLLMSGDGGAPFDVGPLRSLRYQIEADGTVSSSVASNLRQALRAQLVHAQASVRDSDHSDNPIAALMQDFKSLDLPSRLKADVFRDRAQYSEDIKQRLETARRMSPSAAALKELRRIEETLAIDQCEPAVLVDVMLSYRGVGEWDDMLGFIAQLPKVVRDTEMVREQRAMALNRRNRGPDRYNAISILEALIEERGPSSEAYGLLGRIYKDMWDSIRNSERFRALGVLRKAIDAYRCGFDADMRDAFPGINLLTLLDIEGSASSQAETQRLLPVVRYAAEVRLKHDGDYWDHATLLEVAVLARDEQKIYDHLSDALGNIRERPLEPATTARNLTLIQSERARRNSPPTPGLAEAIAELEKQARRTEAPPPSQL